MDLDAASNQPPAKTTDLAVSVLTPATDITVPAGDIVEIEFAVANLTGAQVAARVLVRDRVTFEDTIIAGGLTIDGSGSTRTVTWDTAGFSAGAYGVVAQVQGADGTETESQAPGRITIDSPPGFTFIEPDGDVLFQSTPDPNDPNKTIPPSLTFRFSAFDANGDGTYDIDLDLDTDPNNGNQIILTANRPMPAAEGFDEFTWDGKDVAGTAVDVGVYNFYAVIRDPVNGEEIVRGNGLINVVEPPSDDPNDGGGDEKVAITSPTEDTEIIGTLENITFDFTLAGADDVLVDIKLDPDDNIGNGNELPILYQRLVEKGTTEDSFFWAGLLANDGGVAPDGIYRPSLFVYKSDGSVTSAPGEGLVFRRSAEGQPLIGMTAPTTDQNVSAGNSVLIRWRDDTPDDEFALIRIVLDDDPFANEVVETGGPETLILGSREAVPDGVSDTFTYIVPNTLAPGVYYILGSIDRDVAPPIDNYAAAAGRIIIRDPTAP